MSVFEDLVEELKEDELLEETVIGFGDPVLNETSGTAVKRSQTTTVQPADRKKFNSDEIAALQVVELVFTGVERDLFNAEPKTYDDLAAKQALHRFVHCTAKPDSDEAFEIESRLHNEIENWKQKLLARDAKMSPANVRRYCETSQPPLSSQALFALARFYFSTGLTASSGPKFESILTRLFSKRAEAERREPLLNKEETIAHLTKRYLDWSGVLVLQEDEPEAMLSIMSFEEFTTEAENAESYDALVKSEFFKRLAVFKESVRGQLSSPAVMAACIRGNVAVGNAVVGLLEKFGQTVGGARARKKLGAIGDNLIGLAVGRTIDLEQLFSDEGSKESPAAAPVKQAEKKQKAQASQPAEKKTAPSFLKSPLFAVNKWLLFVSVVLVSLSIGLYLWTEHSSKDDAAAAAVPAIELTGFEEKDKVKTAKISGETMYAVMTSAWDSYDEDKKRELAKKLYDFAAKKGVKRLNIMNSHGATVAAGTPDRIDLVRP
ncbi:MAG TPA: hypothetical protein VL325_05015 [Pyrinomonadaceae bacterium]|nr:hypothetical protein [Pyrinomonadaceae bacterium]